MGSMFPNALGPNCWLFSLMIDRSFVVVFLCIILDKSNCHICCSTTGVGHAPWMLVENNSKNRCQNFWEIIFSKMK